MRFGISPRLLVCHAAVVFAVAGVVSAQPGGPGAPPGGPAAGQAETHQPPAKPGERLRERLNGKEGAPVNKEEMKKRLQKRLEDIEKQKERLHKAIERLDKGDAPGEVMQNLGEAAMAERATRPPGGEKPSPEDRAKTIDQIKEVNPELGARVEAAFKNYPALAERTLGRLGGHTPDVKALKERDPELYELRSKELVATLDIMDRSKKLLDLLPAHALDSKEVQAARVELREAVGRQFDARTQMQARDLKNFEQRVTKLRKELEERDTKRTEQVERSTDEVMKQVEQAGKPKKVEKGAEKVGEKK